LIKKKILFVFLFSLVGIISSYADVDKVEVYFLSRPKVTHINNLIDKYINSSTVFSEIAQSKAYECVPMGEGCFHPQLGMIPLEEANSEKVSKGKVKPIKNFKNFHSDEVDLIDCKDGNYFDIFCGKAKKEKQVSVNDSDYQLWIDTSSSMKQMDYNKDMQYCERRFLVSQLMNACGDNLQVFTFDTAIKSLGDISNVCMNYGMNDGKRMVDWLKRSKAKKVIIITDVDEYTGEFRDYLNLIGAKVHGIGTKMVYASEMPTLTPKLEKFCQ
tara:strand:+ start:26353 stop:27165 length:813 start_codon:yes stop_codon:yes gene_type:complete